MPKNSYVLTDKGMKKVKAAFDKCCSPSKEQMGLTVDLDSDTIRKLLERTGGVNRGTLDRLWSGLQLDIESELEENVHYKLHEQGVSISDPSPSQRGAAAKHSGDAVNVEVASHFYVERVPYEAQCYEAILQPGALIRIKAPEQMGKTWLMSKVLNHAANQGYRTVALNLRLAESTDFTNLDTFLRWFCDSVTVMQELPNMVDEHWNNNSGNSKVKCTSYFQKYLLAVDSPLTLALDELDRVFPYPAIAGDFLSMLRTWCESAKTNDKWKKLRLVLVHEEEYNQMSIDQSPFNVGEEIKLLEFTPKQVCNWVQMKGLDWDTAQVEQLIELVGGRPYLVHEALFCLKTRNDITLEQLLATAPTAEGIYGNHLEEIWSRVQNQPNLVTTLRQVVTATSPVLLESLESKQVSKLLSMRLVKLQGNQVKPSCELYRQYFCARIGDS